MYVVQGVAGSVLYSNTNAAAMQEINTRYPVQMLAANLFFKLALFS